MMNTKANYAEKYAEKEIKNLISWRGNDLEQILSIKENFLPDDKKESKEFKVLQELSLYPNHIAGGSTWLKIMNGILFIEGISEQIKFFYEKQYEEFIEECKKEGEYYEKPLWLVVSSSELKKNIVYPVIAGYGNKKCIVLLINIKEA